MSVNYITRTLVSGVAFLAAAAALAVPAPRPAADAPTIEGCWDCQWGSCRQVMRFTPDGKYFSPEFGGGTWSVTAVDGDTMTVEFQEGAGWYVLAVDLSTGLGSGARITQDGYSGHVPVTLNRRRAMPKGPEQ